MSGALSPAAVKVCPRPSAGLQARVIPFLYDLATPGLADGQKVRTGSDASRGSARAVP